MKLNKKSIVFLTGILLAIGGALWFTMGGFMSYNWYPDDKTDIMNSIIFVALIMSISLRMVRISNYTIILILLADLTLIACSFRGIANGTFFKSLVDHALSFYTLSGLALFVLDWRYRILLFEPFK
jgi:hypothetical protein